MNNRPPPSAAQALYGHLPSAEPAPPPREQPRLAEALYPNLVPKPPPASNPYRASTAVSLAALADENPWLEARLAMSGLRRIRR